MKSIFRTLLSSTRNAQQAQATEAVRLMRQAFELAPSGGAAPSTAPTGSSFDEHAHTAAGLSRRYKLFVPSQVAAAPMLVVMLHGCTQDADDFAAGTRMNARAEKDGFLVLYPIQARTANAAGCWNWFRDQDQRREQGEAAFIADLTLTIARQHHVDSGAVFVAGLSAGAAMAAVVAREYPEVYAAVGLHSGLAAGSAHNVPDAMQAMKSGRPAPLPASASIPTIVFHGDIDGTVHPSNAEHIVDSLLPVDHRGPRVSHVGRDTPRPVTKAIHAAEDGRVLVEHWTLHGADHAWSGGDRSGTFTDPAGPDATGEFVRFFDAHRRPASPARR